MSSWIRCFVENSRLFRTPMLFPHVAAGALPTPDESFPRLEYFAAPDFAGVRGADGGDRRG